MAKKTLSLTERLAAAEKADADGKAAEAAKHAAIQAAAKEEERARLREAMSSSLNIAVALKDVTLNPEAGHAGGRATVMVDGITFILSAPGQPGSKSLALLDRCKFCDGWIATHGIWGSTPSERELSIARELKSPRSIWRDARSVPGYDSTHRCDRRGYVMVEGRSGAERALNSKTAADANAEALKALGYSVRETILPLKGGL